LVHGPHRSRPIELVDGKPIIYSLGDFAFEVEAVTRLPSESYDRYRLGEDAAPAEYHLATRPEGLLDDPLVFAGMAARLTFRDGRPASLQLIPVDLHFDGPAEARGRPSVASPELGRRIIKAVARASAPFGTQIRYNPISNRGEVDLPQRT
jgi:poly-gamma-glutamate synthesis protein (capsule biosynthesis protein)